MLNKTAFARPYAEAAYAQAQEENALGKWADMLQLLNIVASDPQMQALVLDPRISSEQLETLVLDVCADRLTQTGANFVKILLRSERFMYAQQINELYEELRADAENVLDVEVVSAFEMGPEQVTKIVDSMEERYGKKIEISTRIDESLIGGVIIRAGDSVIDASLRGRINKLSQEFV
ncbi:MAG: F0F1 ATP synthase subunit delta [Gammaproteobacteria bacterium]